MNPHCDLPRLWLQVSHISWRGRMLAFLLDIGTPPTSVYRRAT